MLSFLRTKKPYWVGLDINPDEIRLLQLKMGRGSWSVENYAVAMLPEGAIVDGKIKQLKVVQTHVAQLVSATKTQGCPAVIALPASSVISQHIKLAACLSDMECEIEISTNLERYLPGVKEALCFDFVTLGATATDCQEILLVASRLEQLNNYAAVASSAGLIVKVVDVDSYALMRATKLMLGNACEDAVVVLIDVGKAMTQFMVFHQHNIIFSQYWHAEDLALLPAAVQRAMQLCLSAQRHLQISQVVLSGKITPELAPLQDYFAKDFSIKPRVANPFETMSLAKVNAPDLNQLAARFQICCGLALRGYHYGSD